MPYVISLSNVKGGVAKTTSCIALGSSLVEIGYKVLLIDLDPSANLSLGFGLTPDQSNGSSKDLFLLGRAHVTKCVKTPYKNLDIIPSHRDIVSLEIRSLSLNNSAMLIKLALTALPKDSYDFIVIDCPPSLGFLTINALAASDLLIIPTQPEIFSAYSLQTMLSAVREIREEKNPALKYKILVTLLDLRLKEHLKTLDQFQKHLGNSLYKTSIQVDTHLRESQTQRIPITYYLPDSRGAAQYKNLAQEIVDNLSTDGANYFDKPRTDSQESNPPHQNRMTNTEERANNQQIQVETAKPSKSQPTSQEVGAGRGCPFLGGLDNPHIMLSYPSAWNKCHRSKPIISPNFAHQTTYCLSNEYHSCPMLTEKTNKSLPSKLRASREKSELLQHFKNWFRTIIS